MVSSRAGPLRIVFFGTPDFAVPSLRALLASRHTVVAVVTQPDRPRGRGRHLAAPPIKTLAAQAGIPILQPGTLKDDPIAARLGELRPDLGVVAAYGRILPDRLLRCTRLGFINVHASLLPRHRGASPVNHAVMAGDSTTGVTIMRVVRELDAGPMFDQASRPIGPDETSAVIERDLADLGAALLMKTLERLAEGTAVETEQDHSLATYAPRLTRADGEIDWTASAHQVHDKVRGLHPWPHAHAFVGTRRCTILSTDLPFRGLRPRDLAGRVAHASAEGIEVIAGDGQIVRILELQPDGRRRMSARDFLAGHAVTPGDRLDSRG
jgi:methionyl-tRNA formyltransferase